MKRENWAKLTICGPNPHVLHVQPTGALSDVHAHERGQTLGLDRMRIRLGRLCTLADLQIRPLKSAHADVHIPHSRRTPCGALQIPLDQNRTPLALRSALRADNHIRPLHHARLPRRADLHDRLRRVHVREERPAG